MKPVPENQIVGKKITVKHPVHAYYSGYGGKPTIVFKSGDVATVAHVAPKVRIGAKSATTDGRDTFLVADFYHNGHKERVGINWVNAIPVVTANPRAELVDSDWAEAAKDAARKGRPWSTWGTRNGGSLQLLGSHKTKSEAERYADDERRGLRPKGAWKVIVTKENPRRKKYRRSRRNSRALVPMTPGWQTRNTVKYTTLQKRRYSKRRAPYKKLRKALSMTLARHGQSQKAHEALREAQRKRTGARFSKWNPDEGPNLDGEWPDDLLAFWYRHQGGQGAATVFPSKPRGYKTATKLLANYAANKATAMRQRAKGNIQDALRYEDICDRIYKELPSFAQW